MEWLWAALLVLATTQASSRALALMLALKWAANYAACYLVAATAPALIDVGLGTVGVIWASRRHALWSDAVIAGFVLAPLVHGWYWLQYSGGAVSELAYYRLLIALFTLQTAAVAWPAALRTARAFQRRRSTA